MFPLILFGICIPKSEIKEPNNIGGYELPKEFSLIFRNARKSGKTLMTLTRIQHGRANNSSNR